MDIFIGIFFVSFFIAFINLIVMILIDTNRNEHQVIIESQKKYLI